MPKKSNRRILPEELHNLIAAMEALSEFLKIIGALAGNEVLSPSGRSKEKSDANNHSST
jgi:hypothetical protein